MKYDYHIIVIGAGSAGLVVAAGAATLGARVALFEDRLMGGDCLNFGCVPSKAFLKAARVARDIRCAGEFGIDARIAGVDLRRVLGRVQSVVKTIEPHDSEERFRGLGVNVIREKGVITSPHTVRAGGKEFSARHIVIATGSGPMVPPIQGLAGIRYYTNETIFSGARLPKHLIVLGGGPIGLELGQGFRHLGSSVTIIDMLPKLFPRDDAEVGPLMHDVFSKEGIVFELDSQIIECRKFGLSGCEVVIERGGKTKTIRGDMLMVALGRVPATKDLGLDAIGVKTDQRGFVITDPYLRTNVKSIFACGDATGPYLFTHMAGYQAGVVLRNILSPIKAKIDYRSVVWSTYTSPEVAHVGHTEEQAASLGILRDIVLVPFSDNDRAVAAGDTKGFLKCIIGRGGRMIGATCVGEHGGELVSLAAHHIRQGGKLSGFLGTTFPYPTEAEIFKAAGLELTKRSFKPWMKEVVKRIFFR